MQVINVAVKGASALPIGVNINPSVIIVNPQGANTWVSLLCWPFLSTPSPGDLHTHAPFWASLWHSTAGAHHHFWKRKPLTLFVLVQPRGVNIQPTLIAVVPTGKAVVPVGVQVAPYGIAVGK